MTTRFILVGRKEKEKEKREEVKLPETFYFPSHTSISTQ